ncbi:class I SAM-dependent methyltransferase [Bradyrhizobium sp. CCBAU 11386]|uniref:class I SAM-dependent methyltransferase n=1 Tax=Bradyrhizobium sp. CCBAU 11386 TaxID=1630837 RepID=UPI002302A2DA|nr:class I SAM-dependent methyltransferase [Bradyrhizobium sp. CCBAU 11386]
MDISAIYDQHFFEMHAPWRQEYDAIADVLARFLEFSSELDLGCGNGFLIDRLARRHGKHITGIDGSEHAWHSAPDAIRSRFIIADLTAPPRLEAHDLVICSEVAEHLAKCHAEMLVDNIRRHALRSVFFTAATPGQGGLHHVNEQPHRYWIAKFDERKFHLDDQATQAIRGALRRVLDKTWWFADNALVLRPLSAVGSRAAGEEQHAVDRAQ